MTHEQVVPTNLLLRCKNIMKGIVILVCNLYCSSFKPFSWDCAKEILLWIQGCVMNSHSPLEFGNATQSPFLLLGCLQ